MLVVRMLQCACRNVCDRGQGAVWHHIYVTVRDIFLAFADYTIKASWVITVAIFSSSCCICMFRCHGSAGRPHSFSCSFVKEISL